MERRETDIRRSHWLVGQGPHWATYEARRVVVSDSFGITISLEDRVSLHNSILEGGFLLGEEETKGVREVFEMECAEGRASVATDWTAHFEGKPMG